MSPSIKAILFDVGGPLDTCVIMDQMIDDQIMSSFHKHGVDISVDEYERMKPSCGAERISGSKECDLYHWPPPIPPNI